VNVVQQMDVDEFFYALMDKLEELLKPHGNIFLLKRTFGGVFANELICKGCPH
jgi:ubiquitin carboxyl-terminal hydrolase 9/24